MAQTAAQLANLRPPFGPDNPPPKSPGRPRKRPMSEAYDDWLREPVPGPQLASMKAQGVAVKAGMTNADIIALAMGKAAIGGNTLAAKEMREAVEGKAKQRIELTSPNDNGFVVRLQYAAPTKVLTREEAADVKRQMENKTIDVAMTAAIVAAVNDEDD